VPGNRDFFGDRFDAMRWWATSTTSESGGFPVDHEGATPHAIGLTPLQGTREARRGALAGPADSLRPGDVEVIVGEEEMSERACSV